MFNRVKEFFLDIKDAMLSIFFTSDTLKDLRAEPVADYILELYPAEKFDIELLQKRMYLVQLAWLSRNGTLLFKSHFVARRYGPEIPIVRYKFRNGRRSIICNKDSSEQLPTHVKKFIKHKLEEYKDLRKLDEQVLGSAWLNTWFGSEGNGKSISLTLMRQNHPVLGED